MNRIAACIEYRGTQYNGWQRQKHSVSVQEALETAISQVADEPVTVIAAGRTDAGVHAIGQIIHFDTASKRTPYEWLRGVNSALPDDISLFWVQPVPDEFHARFSATSRSYRYVILNRKVNPSYLHGLVSWYHQDFDIPAMQEGASMLVGRHDFSAFRAAGCQSKDPVKEVYQLDLNRSGNWIWLDIRASGFLHHMVRNIVGVLTRIGGGLEAPHWAREVLDSRDRTRAGVTAKPDGLYFVRARYDAVFGLPEPPQICRFW